ncbi:alpha/beta hydrolase [bacterium]|nr:alpha/beta hydrolase [bacterium]
MTIQNRIDPASRLPLDELLNTLPGGFNSIKDIKERRNVINSLISIMTAELPPIDNIVKEDRNISAPDALLELVVRIYKPTQVSGSLPGIFFIHGGGMIMGSIETENHKAAMLCKTIQSIVVSVEYRLAPENPHPAQVQDCYEALVWMSKNAAELGFDTDRLAIVGGSAGGGLAIATALMARDQKFPKLIFQMANYPMIDDRNETPSSKEITDVGIWDRKANIEAWDWYLGGKNADEYAAPARALDLSGLPPTFIDVGELDLFRDEDIEFAKRLLQAGVSTELHVYPGAYHASESFAPEAELSKQIWTKRIEALKRALKTNNNNL